MTGRSEGYDLSFSNFVGTARNANFGAILSVGLGCEVMQLPSLSGPRALREEGRFEFLTIQDAGGSDGTIARGLESLSRLCAIADVAARSTVHSSELIVGLECGGSDGYSGTAANPALEHASDLLVAKDGTTILSETPEIYGAEDLLMARAERSDVAASQAERIRWWEDYSARNDAEMDSKPSPGNKRGELTTILEESLGPVAKGGTVLLPAVYRYAEPVTTSGFVFMDSPGYGPCLVTRQLASGTTLVDFTISQGSVSGLIPSPGTKLPTKSEPYARMPGDIDLDCRDIVRRGTSVREKGQEILRLILDIASGTRSKSEKLGFGEVELVPWQIGAFV